MLLDLVNRFNASQPRHRVWPTYQGDYFEALAKVRTALAAGIAPALTHIVGEVLPYLADAVSWRWTLVLLAAGPVLSVAALTRFRALDRSPGVAAH